MCNLIPELVRVLVIEDEPDLQEAMVSYLNLEGLTADGVGSIAAAESWMGTHEFDILVLDLGLGDEDGLVWLRESNLRQKGVVIATARGEVDDRISGVRAGADAYLVKPVVFEELVAVVNNVARRVRQPEIPTAWCFCELRWEITSPEGTTIKLTRSEMVLMRTISVTPGQVVERDALVRALGYEPLEYDPRRMEILIRRLRMKVRGAIGSELPLETVHRQGYVFTAPVEVVNS